MTEVQSLEKPALDASSARILHTMLRVRNLQKSLDFYVRILGMREMRREKYSTGRFTLSFLGYGPEAENAVLELTHNWDSDGYQHGNAFGHIAIGVPDVYAACENLAGHGVRVMRPPGPMTFAAEGPGGRDVIAFVEDPDGYRIELIQAA